jgi:hypothetical protein
MPFATSVFGSRITPAEQRGARANLLWIKRTSVPHALPSHVCVDRPGDVRILRGEGVVIHMAGPITRTRAVTAMAAVNCIAATALCTVAAWMCVPLLQNLSDDPRTLLLLLTAVLVGTTGVMLWITGVGLVGLKPWGRALQVIVATIGLCAIPVGTILGLLVLLYLRTPGARILFSGRSQESLTADELSDLAALRTSRLGSSIVWAASTVGVLALLLAGAITIPALVAKRTLARERTVVRTLRDIINAEQEYANLNGGYYDTIECLTAPGKCLRANEGSTEPLSGDPLTRIRLAGYRLHFKTAGGVVAPKDTTRVSTSSITGYILIAEPLRPVDGDRSFCADASGVVCSFPAGESAPIINNQCSLESCRF